MLDSQQLVGSGPVQPVWWLRLWTEHALEPCCYIFQIFGSNMHQNEWFQVWFFKKFWGRAHRAPSSDSSPVILGLGPRFGLCPQYSGAWRPQFRFRPQLSIGELGLVWPQKNKFLDTPVIFKQNTPIELQRDPIKCKLCEIEERKFVVKGLKCIFFRHRRHCTAKMAIGLDPQMTYIPAVEQNGLLMIGQRVCLYKCVG